MVRQAHCGRRPDAGTRDPTPGFRIKSGMTGGQWAVFCLAPFDRLRTNGALRLGFRHGFVEELGDVEDAGV